MTARAAWLFVLLTGCGGGEDADVGADASLTVRGGAFFRRALGDGGGGPAVEAAYLGQTQFPAGFQGKTLSGVLGPSATAVAISLVGDAGYWVVPAGPPMVETPDRPSFDTALSFSGSLPAGAHTLELAAVGGDERFGPALPVAFTLTRGPVPHGPLVFSLFWDRPVDLDLHVVLPDGVEVDKDNINSWRADADEPNPDAFRSGGILDFDSNGQCRLDGRNNENVAWTQTPPAGRYIARVDTFSLCGEPAARWSLEARYEGERVAAATGVALPTDVRAAPVTAFELWLR